MFNWFKKKKTESERVAEFEKLRAKKGIYTLGNFEGTPDALELSKDDVEFFPDPQRVFQHPNVDELMPFCVFDVSFVFNDLTGIVGFVHAFREYGEYPSHTWYNEYCTDYMLGFEQAGPDKLKFLGEPELFGCSESYKGYKLRSDMDYQKAKASFHSEGYSYFGEPFTSRNIIRQLGSEPFWVQGDETPAIQGIRFIGQMDSGKFIEDGPYLFLFIDPASKKLYQVEQFT